MTAELKLSQLTSHLAELREVLTQHRRYIVLPAAAVVGYLLFRDCIQDIRDQYFAWTYVTHFLDGINKELKPFREKLKEQLSKQPSHDPRPHNDTTLRILEIGMGSGTNLDFYPKSSRVVGVEPNPYFVDMLLQQQKSHPEFVRVIRGYAEDLFDIQDESIDAVVSTLVLCSVRNLDKALQEIRRVLVKGGRFYFFEHERDHVDRRRYLTQLIASPFLRLIFNNCSVSRDIYAGLMRSGFQMTDVKQGSGFLVYLYSSHITGYVTKV